MSKCFYCEQGETLDSMMVLICELEYTKVYLVKNQNYAGRSVIVFKDHVKEIFELSVEQRIGFINELSLLAGALDDIYHPDKLNYGIYGDNVPHLHCHVVPKHVGGYTWGAPFTLSGGDSFPEASELELTALAIRTGIEARRKKTYG